MEATATVSRTGSSTVADLMPHAAAEYAEKTAVRFKGDDAWHDVSYIELATIVQEIGLGLIDLGIEPGERICILANTRPEWSYADLAATAAGTVVVPIYQTNSPEECLWVISDSGASAIVCEDDAQLAKIAAIREELRDMVRRLASVGYYVLLPNLYYRAGVMELGAFTGRDAEQEDDITLVSLERSMSARYAGGGI